MSNELTSLESALETTLPDQLTRAMRGVGVRIVERPEIQRALIAANSLATGLVIASEEQAREVADLAADVVRAEGSLAGQVKDALRIPKAMEEAVRSAVRGVSAELLRARQTANEARVTWQATLRRRAAEAEAKARQEAQEAAQRATERAAETGEDVPPPAEVAPVEVPRTVSGGTGKMGLQVRIEPVEIVNYDEVPREWLALAPAVARAAFLAGVMERKVSKPLPGESVVWKGLRFEARESAVNRR